MGFLPLLIILGQAGAYWLLARGWVHLHPMPRWLARLFRCFRVLDVLLLVAAGAYLSFQVDDTGWVGVLATGVWLFAVVEFVNYYVVRLSYPVRTWFVTIGEWRTPRLLQDLRRADGSPP